MLKKVRIGIVGTSWWADGHHLPALTSHPKAQLEAVCGRNLKRAEEMAEKYGGKHVFTDYRDMIDKTDLDGLLIVSPDDTHYPITMMALEAGLNVCCEKPLASTFEQAREMYEKAEEKGIINMTYFTFRWEPHYRYLKSLIEDGYLGKCYHGSFSWLFDVGREGNYLWRFDGDRSDGMLGDICSHLIDLSRFFVGEISGVSADLINYISRNKPDGSPVNPSNDSAMLTLAYDNGSRCQVHASAVSHVGEAGYEQRIELYGENGSLKVNANMLGVDISGASAGNKKISPLKIPEEFFGGADRSNSQSVFQTMSIGTRLFIDAIYKNKKVTPGFYDGMIVQKVIDAAKKSNKTGRYIKI